MNKSAGKKIQALRKERKETTKQLADAIGVATQTIIKYECGIRNPSDKKKILIAKHFKLSVGEIFYE